MVYSKHLGSQGNKINNKQRERLKEEWHKYYRDENIQMWNHVEKERGL